MKNHRHPAPFFYHNLLEGESIMEAASEREDLFRIVDEGCCKKSCTDKTARAERCALEKEDDMPDF